MSCSMWNIKCRLMPCTIFFVLFTIHRQQTPQYFYFHMIMNELEQAVCIVYLYTAVAAQLDWMQLCNMVYRMNKIKQNTKHIFYVRKIAFVAWFQSLRYTELCSSILRKRITQFKNDISNLTNHFTRFFTLSILFVFILFFSSGFSFIAHISVVRLSAARLHLCQRNKLSVCQISVQRLRLNQYSNYAYINVMHALFAFIHSIPFINTIFSHCKQKCTRTQSTLWFTFFEQKAKKNWKFASNFESVNIFCLNLGYRFVLSLLLFVSFFLPSFLPAFIVHGSGCLWINNSLKTKNKKPTIVFATKHAIIMAFENEWKFQGRDFFLILKNEVLSKIFSENNEYKS